MATDAVVKSCEPDSDAKGFSITRPKAPYYSDADSKSYRRTRNFWLRWQAYIVECGEIVTPKNIVHCIQPVVLTEIMFWTTDKFLTPCEELTDVSQERVVAWIQDRMIPNSEAVAAWRGEILKAIRGQLRYEPGMTPRNAWTRLNAGVCGLMEM